MGKQNSRRAMGARVGAGLLAAGMLTFSGGAIGAAGATPVFGSPFAMSSFAARNFSINGAPHINGTMRVGNTVEVVGRIGVFTPEPTTWRYQWMRGDFAIPGATGRTYQIRSADAGRLLSVRVTAVRDGIHNQTIMTPVREVLAGGAGNNAGSNVGGGGSNNSAPSASNPVTLEQALAIALRHVGSGRVTWTGRESDFGARWEIEVTRPDGSEVDVYVAADGRVVHTVSRPR